MITDQGHFHTLQCVLLHCNSVTIARLGTNEKNNTVGSYCHCAEMARMSVILDDDSSERTVDGVTLSSRLLTADQTLTHSRVETTLGELSWDWPGGHSSGSWQRCRHCHKLCNLSLSSFDHPGHQPVLTPWSGMNHLKLLLCVLPIWNGEELYGARLGYCCCSAYTSLSCCSPTTQQLTNQHLGWSQQAVFCIPWRLPESGILPPHEQHLELPNLDRDFCISYQFGGGSHPYLASVMQYMVQ